MSVVKKIIEVMKDSEFTLFKSEVRRYADMLGLKEWDIYIENKSNGKESKADVVVNYECFTASISLNKNYKHSSKQELSQTACHEVIHIFLGEIEYLSKNRFCTGNDIDKAEHRICNTLEKILPAIK